MENRKFYHELNWLWRGIKLTIGQKTVISFFFVLMIPVAGMYYFLNVSFKDYFTKEYVNEVGNQINSIHRIFESELLYPGHIFEFLVKNPTFLELVKKDDPILSARLSMVSSEVEGVNISFIYNYLSKETITSNNKNFNFERMFNDLETQTLSNSFSKSYEIIPFDKSIFSEEELIRLGNISDNELVVFLAILPFTIEGKKYLIGNLTVLNNNRNLMDKLYNTFTYNTALFSALSFSNKIVATNSTPKNIFFLNLNLPVEFINELNTGKIVKGIYNIDNEPIAIASIPLKSLSEKVVGGLSIASNMNKLNILIFEFNKIIKIVIFFSSIIIIFIGAVVYNDTKRPIWGIKKALQEIRNKNFDVKLNYKTFDDFEDIANSINDMAISLNQYTTTLNRFNQLNQIITSTLSVDEVLSTATNKILEYTSSQLAVVYLYNRDKDILEPYFVKNADKSSLKDVKMGDGIVGEVAKTKTYFCITDITPDNFLLDTGISNIKPKEIAAFPIAIKDSLLGVMVVGSIKLHSKEELDLVNNLLTQVAIVVDNCITHSKITELSIKDELTNIYNRRYLLQSLETEILKSKRLKSPLSIGIFDIDNFKKINDTYGHPTGDIVLKKFADIINTHKRSYDIFGRFGGEEFLLILPGTGDDEIFVVLDRLRKFIEKDLVKFVGFSVTCSIGGASIKDFSKCNIESLIIKADENLYKAKETGKNKVIVS
ncbi:MAG: two-component system, LuxR family, sensor histidine kinase TtrS [Deferribacteres bacterium]|jgi:diguanylate cyclase (GGDEF)-like protein|nr:two-component system, LuxR family, sensor histidine kinase TtrS [Deferribacteres bacterium]